MTSTKTYTVKMLLADLRKFSKDEKDIQLVLYSDGSGHVEEDTLGKRKKEVFDFHNIRELKKKL